jgi:hypothetical protein
LDEKIPKNLRLVVSMVILITSWRKVEERKARGRRCRVGPGCRLKKREGRGVVARAGLGNGPRVALGQQARTKRGGRCTWLGPDDGCLGQAAVGPNVVEKLLPIFFSFLFLFQNHFQIEF